MCEKCTDAAGCITLSFVHVLSRSNLYVYKLNSYPSISVAFLAMTSALSASLETEVLEDKQANTFCSYRISDYISTLVHPCKMITEGVLFGKAKLMYVIFLHDVIFDQFPCACMHVQRCNGAIHVCRLHKIHSPFFWPYVRL